MPVVAARPDRRCLLRLAGAGVLGITLGIGATLGLAGHGGRSRPAASVRRLDLPAAGPEAEAGAAGARRWRPAGEPR